jgi:hypothetical protein
VIEIDSGANENIQIVILMTIPCSWELKQSTCDFNDNSSALQININLTDFVPTAVDFNRHCLFGLPIMKI